MFFLNFDFNCKKREGAAHLVKTFGLTRGSQNFSQILSLIDTCHFNEDHCHNFSKMNLHLDMSMNEPQSMIIVFTKPMNNTQ